MPQTRILRSALILAGFTLIYFAAGKLGLRMALVNASASAVWPPTGIAVVGLLLLGKRFWPAILLGAFLVNLATTGAGLTSLGIAVGNTLEALCGAWLASRFAGGRHAFERAQDVLKFAVLVAMISTTISASIGAMSVLLGGFAAWPEFDSIWRTWWLGDACGALIVAPVLMLWAAHPRLEWNSRKIIEGTGALLVLLLGGVAIFGNWLSIAHNGYPLLFLLIPMLVWIGFRFAQRETATAMLVLSSVAIVGTIHGRGPFSIDTPNESLLFLQVFLGMISLMSMTLTAAMSERRATEQRLDAQQAATRILVNSRTLSDAMPRILQTICEKLHWEIGNFWQVAGNREHLECVETWSQDKEAMAEFTTASQSIKFARGIGMPGRAWENESIVWIEDVVYDSNFPRAPLAARTRLHSGFAFPINIGEKVFGIVEFFTREFRGSKEELLSMIASVGSQIGLFAEHKLAEEAVKRSEALYRTMAETASDAFLTIDENSVILFVNRAAEQTFGYTAAQMIGQSLTMLMPEEMRAAHLNGLRRYLNTGSKGMPWKSVELPGRHQSGRVFPMELSIGDSVQNGRHIFTGVARDISERKRTDNMLAQHTCIVESSNDAIYSKTLGGIVTSWNRGAESLYGYAASEILGQDVLLLVPPERAGEERETLARVGRGEYIAPYETVRLRKDGTLVDISLTVSPIKTDNRINGASVIARDVTERKRAAAEIERQKASAEAANQAKDEFLAALSHELRTPLTPVLMLAGAMEQSEELPAALRKDFAMIRTNIELEARIIDDLLDLTRITQRKLALRFEKVDPHTLLQHSLEILRNEIQAKQITVALDLSADRHHVIADAVRLEQVLWNIIKNGIKFTPRAGRISIRSWSADAQFHITIADTGLGITAEELPRIFDAFVQGDEAASPRFGGLGLGLSISALLVKEHGGRIWAESPGRHKGATFHLELPLAAPPAPASGDPAPVQPAAGSLRILLVEDHPTTRETLERLLRRRGHVVKSADSVEQALALAALGDIDIVISDLGLPDGHGHDLMRELRRNFGFPGIALSGYGMDGDIEKSKEAGFAEHFTKPVELANLEQAMARVMAAHIR